MKNIFLAAAVAALAACATPTKPPPPTEGTKKLSVETFLYAQLASNSYLPHDHFELPKDVHSSQHVPDDSMGFAYSIYKLSTPTGDRVVMAFRGTETGFLDWVFGNILGLQNDRGLKAYKELRKQIPGNVPIVLVGHSLGGAIAQHVALRSTNVSVFAFNTSTRFTRGPDPQRNPITLVAEFGEVNRALDWFTIDPASDSYTVSCIFGNPIRNHAQRSLAACLTRIAAAEQDSVATWSISANPEIQSVGLQQLAQ